MENTTYIYSTDENVMGPRKKQDPVVPIEKITDMNDRDIPDPEKQNTMQQRADYLTADDKTVSKAALQLAERRLFARKKILKDKFYKFIMQVAGFSNEPLGKLWKNQSNKGEAPLLGSNNSLAYETDFSPKDLNTIKRGIKDPDIRKDLEKEFDTALELKLKADFLNSAEVTGELFLTPNAYSHLLEAWEIIRHRCNVDIALDKLVDTEHSTYFARLVALRIQISRFLSGRYYTVSTNYKRLIRQQELLVSGYFKAKFNSNQLQPNQNYYLHQLQQC